ncbi:DNA internalization-related competence protein ComEC/Rec2 [Nitrospira sp. NS4]|uniref:DNA internalization-related competence protein ComEC/Rec2 n=1 Tax=Nitrospira sp. NS4 TaxID=3414498 RepID=UPI003C2FC386
MLPSLCAAFLTGLVLGALLPFFPVSVALVLVLSILGMWIAERAGVMESSPATKGYAALLLGIVYWVSVVPPPAMPHPVDETPVDVGELRTGRIIGPVQHAPHRVTLLVRIESPGKHKVAPKTVRLTWRDPGSPLFHGDRIAFRSKLRRPTGSLNPGGFDYAAYVERQGIDAVATVTGREAVRVLEPGSTSWWWAGWGLIDRWRGTIHEAALRTLSQPALGIFLGMIIGERGYLQEDVQEWFMVTGTVHLLSISGSHLGLIAIVLFGLVRWMVVQLPAPVLLDLSRRLTPTRCAIFVTWAGVALYALLAGAETATLRAWIMITAGLAAVWVGSERYLFHALAGAAVVIVLHDPRAIGDISFQLSFLSVLAIVQVAEWHRSRPADADQREETRWERYRRAAREAVVLSVAVTIVTTPLVAWYFNQIPWIGVLTNMVAVPLTGFVFVPLGLLTAAWTLVFGIDGLSLGMVQQRLIEWLVGGLHWIASWPVTDWRVSAPSVPVIGLFYGGLLMAVGITAGQRCRVFGLTMLFSATCLWGWEGSPAFDEDRWRVTFLDVGQGDSAVIELPDEKVVLIDGGAKYERFDVGRGVVGPFLWNHGIRKLDAVIATHPQLDHVGGLPWILRHFEVREYWHAGVERHEPLFEDLRRVVWEQKVLDRRASRGQDIVSSGGCQLAVLNPFESDAARPVASSVSGTQLNNHSIVTQLECGAHAILFAADVESEGLRRLAAAGISPVTVLKVPHHGGRSSLDQEWVARVHPRHAVISVGRHNAYGHPVQAVLDAYAGKGSEVYRTDLDGAIIVTGRISTAEVRIQRTRDVILRPTNLESPVWQAELENWQRLWRQRSGL